MTVAKNVLMTFYQTSPRSKVVKGMCVCMCVIEVGEGREEERRGKERRGEEMREEGERRGERKGREKGGEERRGEGRRGVLLEN